MLKQCTKCSSKLPLDNFYKDSKQKDGKNSWCRSCFNSMVHTYYETPEGRYVTLKKDAKARGIPFTITVDDYKSIRRDCCKYCGGIVKNAAGIDRLDNSKGYEPCNIIPSCKWCNYAKGTWSARSFYEKCLKVVENFPKEYKTNGSEYSDDLVK